MGAITRLSCPHCNRKSSTAQQLSAGVNVRCPGCQKVFSYLPEPEPIELAEIEIPPLPKKTGVHRPDVVRTDTITAQQQIQPQSFPLGQVINVNVPETRKGNSLAIAALVLGIIAALICWVPFLGLFAIPVGLLGLLLGLIGLLLATLGRRSGLSSSLVGTAISLGSIVPSVVITGRTAKSISDAFEEKRPQDGAVVKPVKNAGKQTVALPRNKAGMVNPDDQRKAGREKPAPSEEIPEELVVAPTPAKLGDVVVVVLSVKVSKVALKGLGGAGESADALLIVNLGIGTTNPNRKIDYQTWAGQDISIKRDFATISDNNSNHYKRIGFGFSNDPIGRTDSNSIYPDKPVTDVLVFEVPLKTAEFLTIELPASNVGEKGFFRIRIPDSMIER